MLITMNVCVLATKGQNTYTANLCKLGLREGKASAKKNRVESRVVNNYNLYHLNCYWKVNPNVNFISGNVRYYFKPLVSTSGISFDCSQSLAVDSIVYHHTVCAYTHANDLLSINLPQPAVAGSADSIRIYYNGIPVSTGFGSFEQQDHGQGKALWTLSEPYGAKNWWPCKQDLSDKIDSIDVSIQTPLGYTAVSNGLLKEALTTGSYTTYTFKHRYPIDYYLIALAVSNYERIADTVIINNQTLPINSYAYPQSVSMVSTAASLNKKALRHYSNYFGSYPFFNEQYGHCQTGMGGGMEHQTISFEGYWGDDLLAHELAHQWFGDKITCASWKDIWLNEGFATYLTALTLHWNNDTINWEAWKTNTINLVTNDPGGSVYVDDTSTVERVFDYRLTYAKASYVLHMLRANLGDSSFYAGVKSYITDSALIYKTATTADLKRHLELSSGQDLTEFFNDWVYGQGYPSVHLNWRQDTLLYKTDLNFTQTTSHSSVSFFESPVDVYFKGEERDTLIRLNLTGQNQAVELVIPFVIKEIKIDPEKKLLSFKNTINAPFYKFNDLFVHLYPNPFTDVVYLDYYNTGDSVTQIRILDVNGHLAALVEPDAANGFFEYGLPVSTISRGFYFVEVYTESGKKVTLKACKL